MMYFEDMSDKYGFNDGEAIPTGVDQFRKVYVEALNILAEKYGSKFRAVEYNRNGFHNWCLILFSDGTKPERYLPSTEVDNEMQKAISIARDMELDDHVSVVIKMKKSAFARIVKDAYSSYVEGLEEQYHADEA